MTRRKISTRKTPRRTRKFMDREEIVESGIDIGGADNKTNGEPYGASAKGNDPSQQ